MKKYIILSVVTVLLLAGTLYIPEYIKNSVPETEVIRIEEVDYIRYVTASGEIAQTNQKMLVSDFPLIVEDVLVKSGDRVIEGQPIITVDKEETSKKAASLSSYGSIVDIPSDMASLSYQEVMNKLPSKIISTISGTVDTVSAQKGQYLEKGGTIATLISDGSLVAQILVPENKISEVALGQKVDINGSGFEDKTYTGTVKSIGSSAKKTYVGSNQETVVEVIATIDNCDDDIKSGYTIQGKIYTQEQKKINIIPYESIMQDDEGKEYVYVLSDGIAVRKDIQTGIELSEGVQILSGLSQSDTVIATPSKVKENSNVVIVTD